MFPAVFSAAVLLIFALAFRDNPTLSQEAAPHTT
ncbi:hypothetical protein OUY23_03360 [Pseudomonas aeruginosa]|nr:hypothetical protein [Pseudomonas aeruginosa]WAE25598.1 hypothetical protein OUY23_03360 [Pseudomonas aeruginosa]